MPPPRVHTCPATHSDYPEESSPAGNDPIEDVNNIPTISWDVAAQSSLFCHISHSAAAVLGSLLAILSPVKHVDLAQATALVEKIPGVMLIPPLDEDGTSCALLTSLRNPSHWVCSGGSSASAPPKKRLDKGKGHAEDPLLDMAGLPGPAPTIHIPPHCPPLADILEQLLCCPSSPSTAPLPPTDWIYCSTMLMVASRGLDLKDPTVLPHILTRLTELAPGVDFTDLLEEAADTPAPLDRTSFPFLPHHSLHPLYPLTLPHYHSPL
ncbi:hypothetical protein JVT61DRAFT_12143 [Boletus reticuloceps]|uniref:Uncharacterized protein n=1 Tax=Boletus reticuloceps TaxID=495285 RepID=A0A8I2YE26_9AGAM|nr:hypothetical protein JVT61DRAFT_12143 [Boletus reticuloceps]